MSDATGGTPGASFRIVSRRDGRDCLSLEELSVRVSLHPDLVARYVAYGLIEPLDPREEPPSFAFDAAARLRTICRLRSDIGINLAGIAVILDLLDRMRALQREVDRLRSGDDAGG